MSYVEKSLGTDEELKYRFQFHWFVHVYIYAFHLLMLVVVFLMWSRLGVLSILAFIPSGIYHLWIINTEHAATSKRVIIKKGIIARKTEEQMLAKVETIEVNQGILGRVLGYGNIKVTGTGTSAVVFKDIDEPLEVKKQIEGLL